MTDNTDALPEPDCWAVLTPNGSKLVSPDEAKGLHKAYPLFTADQLRAALASRDAELAKLRQWRAVERLITERMSAGGKT